MISHTQDMAQFIFPASSLHAWHPTSKVFPATDEATTAAPPSPMENPTVLPTALLRRFKHTFLMRTPERSVPSYYKCTQNNAAGFNFFDPAEMGFVELQRLYDWMANPASTFHTDPDDERFAAWPVQTSHGPPPLMDASVLLSHPGYVVSLYCEATQVPFDPSMLSWDQGAVDIWAKWGTYHAAAEQSSGFQETKMETPLEEQPSIVKDTIAYVPTSTYNLQPIDADLPCFAGALYHSSTAEKVNRLQRRSIYIYFNHSELYSRHYSGFTCNSPSRNWRAHCQR